MYPEPSGGRFGISPLSDGRGGGCSCRRCDLVRRCCCPQPFDNTAHIMEVAHAAVVERVDPITTRDFDATSSEAIGVRSGDAACINKHQRPSLSCTLKQRHPLLVGPVGAHHQAGEWLGAAHESAATALRIAPAQHWKPSTGAVRCHCAHVLDSCRCWNCEQAWVRGAEAKFSVGLIEPPRRGSRHSQAVVVSGDCVSDAVDGRLRH